MAKCPRSDCNGTSFRLKEITISGAAYKHQSVQCSSCGAVVAVLGMLNVDSALMKIAQKLGVKL